MEVSVTEILLKILEKLSVLEQKVDRLSRSNAGDIHPYRTGQDAISVGVNPEDIRKKIEDMKKQHGASNTPGSIGMAGAGNSAVMAGMGLMSAAGAGMKRQDKKTKEKDESE